MSTRAPQSLPPLSLYLHLPWCVSKCPYCDFNSHKAGDPAVRERYLAALAVDLDREAGNALGRRLETVFIGGGTPSLFTPAQIASLLEMVAERLTLDAGAEITMEANPGTIERGRLSEYRDAGVNRLSLGVQSLDATKLRVLGRIHGPDDVFDACREASSAGFDSINLDLMFGLPGQTLDDALLDIDRAIALKPAHMSYYQLTLEPNTVFHERPPAGLPDGDLAFEMQTAAHERLAAAGYGQYEISAFSRPGFECRHNLNYWNFGDYLGVGAGAHGKLTDADWHVRRRSKPLHPQSYIEQHEAADSPGTKTVLVEAPDRVFEFMLNALRLSDGFTEAGFESRTGLSFDCVRERLREPGVAALIAREKGGRWRPSERGFRFLNDLQAHFLPTGGGRGTGIGQVSGVRRTGTVIHKTEA